MGSSALEEKFRVILKDSSSVVAPKSSRSGDTNKAVPTSRGQPVASSPRAITIIAPIA
jgi:hypothetical protein